MGACEHWMNLGLENDTFQQWTGQWGDLSNVPSRYRGDEQGLCDLVVQLVRGRLHGCGGCPVDEKSGGFGNVGVIYSGTCVATSAKSSKNDSNAWGRYLTASDGSRLSVRFEPHNLFDCALAPSQLGRFSVRRERPNSAPNSNTSGKGQPPVVRTLLFFGWPHGAQAQLADCLANVHDQKGAPTGCLGHPLRLFSSDEATPLDTVGVAGALLGSGAGGDGDAPVACLERTGEQARHAVRCRFQNAEKRALAAGHCSAAFTQAYLAASNVLLLSEPLGIMLLNTLPSLSGALPDLHTGPCGTNTVLAVAVRIAMAPSLVYWLAEGLAGDREHQGSEKRTAVLEQTKGAYEDVYARGVARVAFESTTQPLVELHAEGKFGAAEPAQPGTRRRAAVYRLDVLVRWLLLKARSGSSTPDSTEAELFLRLYRIGQRVVTVCFGARPFMCPTEQDATSDHISNTVDRFVRAMVYKSGSVLAGEAEAHNPLLETSVASDTDLAGRLCGILCSVEAWLQTGDKRVDVRTVNPVTPGEAGGAVVCGAAEADTDADAVVAQCVSAFEAAAGVPGCSDSKDISSLALKSGLGALCASLGVWSSGTTAPLSAETYLVGDTMHRKCVDCESPVHVVEAVLFAHDGTTCAERSKVRCLRCARQRLKRHKAV